MKYFAALLLCFFFVTIGSSQSKIEYLITINGNLYVPYKSNKAIFPMIGYDKQFIPKILIGGFGAGFHVSQIISEKVSVKGQANISRSVYWESYVFTDGPQLSDIIGEANVSTTDYSLGLTGLLHYHLSQSFSMGIGFGIQTLLISNSFIRDDVPWAGSRNLGQNRYYKPCMPTIPLETSLRLKKWMINLRYEHALLNRMKKGLADYKQENYGLLFFELGFQIN
jgi:hypothetical protein